MDSTNKSRTPIQHQTVDQNDTSVFYIFLPSWASKYGGEMMKSRLFKRINVPSSILEIFVERLSVPVNEPNTIGEKNNYRADSERNGTRNENPDRS